MSFSDRALFLACFPRVNDINSWNQYGIRIWFQPFDRNIPVYIRRLGATRSPPRNHNAASAFLQSRNSIPWNFSLRAALAHVCLFFSVLASVTDEQRKRDGRVNLDS